MDNLFNGLDVPHSILANDEGTFLDNQNGEEEQHEQAHEACGPPKWFRQVEYELNQYYPKRRPNQKQPHGTELP